MINVMLARAAFHWLGHSILQGLCLIMLFIDNSWYFRGHYQWFSNEMHFLRWGCIVMVISMHLACFVPSPLLG